ncbi:MAG: trypsin-like peptidase domain-containing protein [Pseudomonadota bacterium]
MTNTRRGAVALVFFLTYSLTVNAAKPQPEVERSVVGNAIEYALDADLSKASRQGDKWVWTRSIAHPGASFIKAHIHNMNLRPGDALHIINDRGRVVETLTGQGPKSRINFWALSSQGEGMTLRFEYHSPYDKMPFGIDRLIIGSADMFKPAIESDSRSICSPEEFDDAVCIQNDAGKWANAQAAVGVMSVGGNANTALFCSGSNVSPNNVVLTNQHCVGSQLQCDGTEYVFNFYRTGCNIGAPTTTDWQGFRCDEMLASEPFINCDAAPGDLDFALTTVEGDPAATFGYADIDTTPLTSGEEIYILQHPDGRPLEITQGSGTDVEVDGTVLRYYNTLDTEGGSSGSAIYRASDNKLVALHHCGGCTTPGVGNRGMLMTDIAPLIEPFLCTDSLSLEFTGASDPVEVIGNGDTIIEPGESWQFTVQVRNASCSQNAADVVAQIGLNAAVTDAIVIDDSALSFGNVDAGSSAVSAPITITIPTDAMCGNTISFDLTALSSTGGGTFEDVLNTVSLPLGDVPDIEIYNSGFDAGAGAWSVIDGGSGGGAAATWTDTNPGGRTLPLIAPYMIIDSDAAGTGSTQEEELVSPVIDTAQLQNVRLQFTHDFNWYTGGQDEQADVDVRSTATNGQWVTIANFSGGDASGVVSLDITAYRAFDFQVRLRYYNASYEWWWAVDDVFVLGDNGFVCDVFGVADADGDGVNDSADNCTLVANADQTDVDGDGYGNICDPDFNNDNVVNFADVAQFSAVFNTTDTLADLNGDGAVNFLDFAIVSTYFLSPPGPSGLVE